MSPTLRASTALISVFSLTSAATAQAVLESLPDHIERRIAADQVNGSFEKLVDLGRIQHGVLAGAKRWPTTDPVKVCFFGGTVNLRTRIMTIANQWVAGSPLRFDWGNPADPRLCGGGFSHIRVGFSPTGYWSLLGQDSVIYAPQTEQSLNLGMFDFNPPADPEFTSTVLHEFGHALGFQHEHQHPVTTCEPEFNWPAIYSYLAGPPNYWSKQKVDHNMRSRPYMHGDITTTFDANSIMLYSFPQQFYKRGATSPCFTRGNTNLSTGDRQTFALAYGNREQQLASIEGAASALSPSSRALVLDRVSLLRLNNNLKAAVVGRSQLDQVTPTFGAEIGEATAPIAGPD